MSESQTSSRTSSWPVWWPEDVCPAALWWLLFHTSWHLPLLYQGTCMKIFQIFFKKKGKKLCCSDLYSDWSTQSPRWDQRRISFTGKNYYACPFTKRLPNPPTRVISCRSQSLCGIRVASTTYVALTCPRISSEPFCLYWRESMLSRSAKLRRLLSDLQNRRALMKIIKTRKLYLWLYFMFTFVQVGFLTVL